MTASRLLRTALALLVAAALTPALASAAPAVDGEFALSGKPVHLAQGPDGNIWVALTDSTLGNDIAKVTPAGAVTEYDLPGIINTGGVAAGPDGNMWATHSGGVFRFAPANPTGGTDTAVAQIGARPIVVGSDNNLWTASGTNVVRLTTATPPVATPFAVTLGASDIVRGGDGMLYIADTARVVGLATDGVTQVNYPTGGGNLQGVAAGPGNQIAYTNPVTTPEQIGRITPGNLTPMTTDQPNIDPTGIVLGNDGAYWIANFNSTSLTRFATDGTVTSLPGLSAGSGARFITTGPGDTLWVGLETAMKVARITGVVAPPAGGGGGEGGGGSVPPPTGDKTRPKLSSLSLLKLLRVGSTTNIRVTLSEAAKLTLRFERVRPGRRAKSGKCVAPAPKLHKAHRCTRFVTAGSLTKSAGGTATIAFSGRIGHRQLAIGSYRLTVTAKDAAGNVSKPLRTRFAIAPKKQHRAHR